MKLLKNMTDQIINLLHYLFDELDWCCCLILASLLLNTSLTEIATNQHGPLITRASNTSIPNTGIPP